MKTIISSWSIYTQNFTDRSHTEPERSISGRKETDMTVNEYRTIKNGDKITHMMYPNTICVIDGDKTPHGFFHRPEGSKGGWNTINEKNCKYYSKAE